MQYDVIVVGAGPAGCRTADLVSSKGYSVLLIEEHKTVGKPVQCAGLVSWRLKELLPRLPKNVIINTVNRAKFFSQSVGFELKSKKRVYVIDRAKLDRYLYNRAKKSAKVKLGTRFVSFTRKRDYVKVETTKGTFESKVLVGADGPNSMVAKQAGLRQPDNKLVGVQTTADGKFDKDSVELWFGKEVSPEFFGWVIPLSSRKARIGIATKNKARQRFDKFLKSRIGKTKKPDVAGIINFGLMDTVAERIMFVGDAACQVKPFSGGGVIYSLICAEFCSQACIKSLKKGRFDKVFLNREYDKKWKKELEKPIKRGMLYSKMLHGSDLKLKLMLKFGKKMKSVLQGWDMDLL
jgi:digeranylgeranylglycerophospholipid reductase